jgi:hypothetical protein
MSFDPFTYLESARFEYDRYRFRIRDDTGAIVAELGRRSLIRSNESMIHTQGRLLAAAPELRRCLENLVTFYARDCPDDGHKRRIINYNWALLNRILDE